VLDDDDIFDFRGPLFTRFTPRAREAVATAREQAQRLAAERVEPSHLVLGLLAETKGIAARALADQGIALPAALARFEEPAFPAKAPPGFARESKRVLQRSLREALKRGHNYIGTEHVLLGILADNESSGASLLAELGTDIAAVDTYIDTTLASSARPKRRRS
jgi:ATP-dependent Clp protease ATP-binding subunit ClpA